jgi:hypothetical protein
MQSLSWHGMKSIHESARDIPVFAEADVLVCGGGPAGVAAAMAAARRGAKTVLLERYGCLGGLATGGLVIVLPRYIDHGIEVIGGIGRELRDAMIDEGTAVFRKDRGDASEFDPEALKRQSAERCHAAGVDVIHHVWIAAAIIDHGAVRGVIVESKSGRMAILARCTVDATGDGDVFASAGTKFETSTQPIGLPCRITDVDVDKWHTFARSDNEAYNDVLSRVKAASGFRGPFALSASEVMPGVVWGNNGYVAGDALDVRVLSRVEREARSGLHRAMGVLRVEMPGFERAVLFETAAQLGVRRSRRLVGQYVMTNEDVSQDHRRFDDAIGRGNDFRKQGFVYDMPYRSLLPRELNGLLVAGRCMSCTHAALEPIREIHVCWVMGEAAGLAAALATERNVAPSMVDIKHLQRALRDANAALD